MPNDVIAVGISLAFEIIEFKAPKGLEMKHLDGKWSYLISHPQRPRMAFTQILDWK